MQVAEIAVRFGDSTLDNRQLASGAFRIGTGRDVDLAVPGLTSFPLVDWSDRGCMVRVPAGIAARKLVAGVGTPLDGAIVLARGERVEVAIGSVEIAIELAARPAPLPRPRFDMMWPRWIAGALVAHLIALIAIDALAEPEPEGIRLSLVSLLPRVPEPPPPPLTEAEARNLAPRRRAKKQQQVRVAVVEPAPAPIETDPDPTPAKARAIKGARRAGILGGSFSAEDIRAITGTRNIEEELSDVGPVYRDYEAQEKGFGGGRRFDPTKREGWGSVATGRYATVDKGRAAGDHYALPGEAEARPVPRVAHCVGACSATGGLSRDAVRAAIARHDEAILGCYERAGLASRGDVVVEVRIGEDGTVITADGAGLGSTGGCVAGVIRRVAFPRAAATTVRYPLSFSPS